MESLEQLLAEMAAGQEDGRDLEFRVDPARVRQTLSTLIKADRLLWLKHLWQWLYGVELEEPPNLVRLGKNVLRLQLTPSQADLCSRLTPSRLLEKEGNLLGQSVESRLARILCEVDGPLAYLHSAEPRHALLISAEKMQLGVVSEFAPERGFCLDFSVQAIVRTSPLFAFNLTNLRRVLQPIAGLHPDPPRMMNMQHLCPDWPFLKPIHDSDDDIPSLWDWESVDPCPDHENGFLWTVPTWGERLESPEESHGDQVIFRHPIELPRSTGAHPIMACCPPQLARRISDEPLPDNALLTVRCWRVFGISWTAAAPKKAELIPVLLGVPGTSIVLDGAPAGLYLLADASHLCRDASGLSLVADQQREDWIKEQVRWAKAQTEFYLPRMRLVPQFWMAQSKRWEDIGRRPSVWKRAWQSAVTGLFSIRSVRGLLARRAETLSAWTQRRD